MNLITCCVKLNFRQNSTFKSLLKALKLEIFDLKQGLLSRAMWAIVSKMLKSFIFNLQKRDYHQTNGNKIQNLISFKSGGISYKINFLYWLKDVYC